ncbi:MAG TPA: GTPase ObgE [Candidatus Paceibacterota bacterium]|nr:GTPase ObgE [Candidatus Paceibacterota bacterium]
MLIDDVTIEVAAGNGGKGAVAFNKTKMMLGPAGGSGGDGGSIYLEGVIDIGALRQFRHTKKLAAESGQDGRGQFVDGKRGANLVLKVPVGTVVHDLDGAPDREVTKIGERLLVAQGGVGGRGNFHFRSSTNTSPKQFEEGKPGEERLLRLELKLIADIGLVGLPNVGKSSLLNELTNAKAKVANYAFTTLEPNLGVFDEFIIADIPGLIEGASGGKGLGIKFLRHIERTRILFHLVSADSADPVADYRTVREELGAYRAELLEKPEYVFLSRSDDISAAELKKKLQSLKKLNPAVQALTLYDDASVAAVKKMISQLERQKHA